jgi:hypothetical protein
MNDDHSFRRLGRKDRKGEIKADPDFLKAGPDTASEGEMPDLSMLTMTEDEVAQLAALPEGLVARPLKVTPEAQRFPPVAPSLAPQPEAPAEATSPMPSLAQVPPRRRSGRGYNLLTLLMLLLTAVWCGLVAIIWQDPQTALNPFAPPILYVRITATFLPPTPASAAPPTAEPLPYPFQAQPVAYSANENGRGCEWASIAGTVTAPDGSPLNAYRVRITSTTVDTTVFSGAAASFGPGGYEFPIGGAPAAERFTVQLLSPEGAPLTAPLTVDTRATCAENVARVDFVER